VIELGMQIENGVQNTDMLFQKMMRLEPGPAVARRYGEFLLEMANDPKSAMR